MDRKNQLLELIEANKRRQAESTALLLKYDEELKIIKAKVSKKLAPVLVELRKKLEYNPDSFKVREELTRRSLEMEQGTFVAWRGGQGSPPQAQYVEIEQPIFNSENVLDDPPIVKQHFQVLAVLDSVSDLKRLLDLQPDGLISLPEGGLHYFNEWIPDTPEIVEQETNDAIELRARSMGSQKKYPGTLERIYQPLYDTNTVATSGTGQLNFFQVPLGGCAAGARRPKTQVETNMDQGGSLPYPKSFKITGISIVPDASAKYHEVAKIMDNSWFRLFIGTKDYFVSPTLPLAFLPGKRSPGVNFRLHNPLRPVLSFPEPIPLIPQQNFRAEINFPNPQKFDAPINLRVILHGYFFRDH